MEYLKNNLAAGKSVNIKKFGSFTFDISTDLPKIATKNVSSYSSNLIDQRLDRKHVHNVKYIIFILLSMI